MNYKTFIVFVICFAAGCTNPVNMYTADRYYHLGVDAEIHGDLDTACMYFPRSYGNTVIGNAPPLARAHALYEYARVSGYLGRLAEAEKGFNEVIALLDKVPDDPTRLRTPTHSEHAKLLFANRRYQESISEFAAAVAGLDEISAESRYPGDLASFLTSYAKALRAVQSTDQAGGVEKRVAKILLEHPGAPVISREQKYILADEIPAPSPQVTPLIHSSRD